MPISRLCHHLYTDDEPAFIFTVVTTGVDETFTLPLEASGSYDFKVVWGDGNDDDITAYDDAAVTHTFASAGTYTVVITKEITGWRFGYAGDRKLIHEVREWGPLRLGNNGNYFAGCENLTVIATDILDMTGTTTLENAFEVCWSLITVPSMNSWDVSSVTNMSNMFNSATLFNQDISGWDVSSVTDMLQMFWVAGDFDQDVSSWDVSSVLDMSGMFGHASYFNQDIGGWDVSSCTNMYGMFNSTKAFNQDLNSWDVSKVTTMNSMFGGAEVFNQDISGWDVSSVLDMGSMFSGAEVFNQDISGWVVSSVADMNYMFSYAALFNQDISGWDVSSVADMANMFDHAYVFNQDISSWDVSSVTDMKRMFRDATLFEQDIGGWVITAVADMAYMFDGVTLSTANYDALLIGWEGQAVQDNVSFDGGDSKYSAGAAATARQALIDDHTWAITDGGQV